MSAHWRLAIHGAVRVSAGAALVGVVVWFLYGAAYAGSFFYGAGVGILSFISTALTVSLLMGRSKAFGMMIGGASFAARYGFAAVALGVPAYLSLWPLVAMLVGFAGVYLVENVVLLPRVLIMRSDAERPVYERVERRVEA